MFGAGHRDADSGADFGLPVAGQSARTRPAGHLPAGAHRIHQVRLDFCVIFHSFSCFLTAEKGGGWAELNFDWNGNGGSLLPCAEEICFAFSRYLESKLRDRNVVCSARPRRTTSFSRAVAT